MNALLALFLVAAAAPEAPAAPPPAGDRIEVLQAGEIAHEVGGQRGAVTGGVVLRRGLVVLRADRATYDLATGTVDAEGGVLLTEPGRALAAQALHAVLDGPYEAHDVVAYLKDGPLDLSRCRAAEEARATGRNRATLRADAVRGEAGGAVIEAEHPRVTLCDCGSGLPSWEIRASGAHVVPGDHAWLWWPVLYLTPRFLFWHHELQGRHEEPAPLPVLPLPALYVPLQDRQSGLLLPELTFGGQNGFTITQPLFLTLGRSWDATLSATWVDGPSQAAVAATGRGVRGPGGAAELRWAPAEGTWGEAHVSLQHSTIGAWPAGASRPPGDDRLALGLTHVQRLGARSALALDVGLVNDPYYAADFSADQLLRAVDYRRSAAALTAGGDDLLVEADAAYLEPLTFLDASPTCAGGACGPAPFGTFGSDVPVLHRLGAASATLLPVRLAGPLRLSASAGVARFAPWHGDLGDEGADGIGPGERGWPGGLGPGPGRGGCAQAGAPGCDAAEGDGRWQGAERLAATRASARAELRAPFAVGALRAEPWLAGTALGYGLGAGQGETWSARGVAGASLETTLRRTFGEGSGRLRHELVPRLAWVAGLAPAGPGLPQDGAARLGGYAYDELDVAAPIPAAATGQPWRRALSATPGGGFNQAQLSLRSRLAGAAPGATALDLAVGQDLDLDAGRLSETWVDGALTAGPLAVTATARFLLDRPGGEGVPATAAFAPSFLDAFSALQAAVRLGDARGDEVHVGLLAVGKGGSPRLLAGLEPLFDPRPLALDPVAQGHAGAAARLGAAALAYDAWFYARDLAAPPCPGAGTAAHVFQHTASAVWDSPCRCWKAGLALVVNECVDRPQWRLVVDLSSLAERGFGR